MSEEVTPKSAAEAFTRATADAFAQECDRCPFCGEEEDLDWDNAEFDCGGYWQEVTCLKCGESWVQQYAPVAIHAVHPGTESALSTAGALGHLGPDTVTAIHHLLRELVKRGAQPFSVPKMADAAEILRRARVLELMPAQAFSILPGWSYCPKCHAHPFQIAPDGRLLMCEACRGVGLVPPAGGGGHD